VPKDDRQAFLWIGRASELGFDKAQYNLGKRYRDGQGVGKDLRSAARWFLAADEQGHARAQNHIGIRFARGEGVAKDPIKALM
jgi:TPR repeat protein